MFCFRYSSLLRVIRVYVLSRLNRVLCLFFSFHGFLLLCARTFTRVLLFVPVQVKNRVSFFNTNVSETKQRA